MPATQIIISPATEAKADPVATTMLGLIRAVADKEQVPVVAALRGTLAAHPKVTRVGFKHAAIAVGINWKTARNTYDRVQRGA